MVNVIIGPRWPSSWTCFSQLETTGISWDPSLCDMGLKKVKLPSMIIFCLEFVNSKKKGKLELRKILNPNLGLVWVKISNSKKVPWPKIERMFFQSSKNYWHLLSCIPLLLTILRKMWTRAQRRLLVQAAGHGGKQLLARRSEETKRAHNIEGC